MSTPTTFEALRRAVEALPEGSSITLPRQALLDALTNGAPEAAPVAAPRPERWLTATQVAERLGVKPRYVYEHAK